MRQFTNDFHEWHRMKTICESLSPTNDQKINLLHTLTWLKHRENKWNSHRPLTSALLLTGDQSIAVLWHHTNTYIVTGFWPIVLRTYRDSKIGHMYMPPLSIWLIIFLINDWTRFMHYMIPCKHVRNKNNSWFLFDLQASSETAPIILHPQRRQSQEEPRPLGERLYPQPAWVTRTLQWIPRNVYVKRKGIYMVIDFNYSKPWVYHFHTLQWCHNGRDSVSNHQPHDCFLNRLFRNRSKKTSKLRVTGLCAGNSPEAGEFPAQMASYAENVSIWWRHHIRLIFLSNYISVLLTHWGLEMPHAIMDIGQHWFR